MNAEKIFPFQWTAAEPGDTYITYSDVIFSKEFGLFLKNTVYDCITVDIHEGTMTLYDDQGNIEMQQNFACHPIL